MSKIYCYNEKKVAKSNNDLIFVTRKCICVYIEQYIYLRYLPVNVDVAYIHFILLCVEGKSKILQTKIELQDIFPFKYVFVLLNFFLQGSQFTFINRKNVTNMTLMSCPPFCLMTFKSLHISHRLKK